MRRDFDAEFNRIQVGESRGQPGAGLESVWTRTGEMKTVVWYICAMKWKDLGKIALPVIVLAALAVLSAAGQQSDEDTPPAAQAVPHTPAARPAGSAQGSTGQRLSAVRPAAPVPAPAAKKNPTDCEAGPCDYQPAQIAIATPAPAAPAWPWQDRIAWVANMMLVVLAAVGIALGLGLFKKIERQTHYAEAAAQAAAETAQALLAQTQAVARAERPWVLVTVEPSQTVENGFMVVATNRGRTPARLVSVVDKIAIEAGPQNLPATPQYADAHANAALAAVILLPGESTGIKPFSREDVKQLCGSDERLRKVEKWEEVILLYGRVAYQDLLATDDLAQHETGWCFWYIHGRQNSGMVTAGSPAYNRHA